MHRYQPSSRNLRRYADLQTRSGIFVWYSGNTAYNAVGSLMIYRVEDGQTECGYALLEQRGEWICKRSIGLLRERVADFADVQPTRREGTRTAQALS